ncbi:recombinase family protein [Terracoccus sp. 273MFTsu3.1]|uniref:recombinase family protein n=1 Tax=Terracoccus sp. 273MFTsu3.1 TaxID=1172188 RepID=UPI000377E828|nr:recombinase family protein [Terracoccus sp. 273MFTsu3.1]
MATKKKRSAFKRRGNRVIIYIRVSDTTGREDRLISHKVQEDQCARLSQREGLDVIDVISDIDLSGRTSEKRAIRKIIDRIERGEADGVVVWKISRWGRNTIDSMLNIGELQDAGGFIASASENLDEIDTPAGKFQLTVLLAIAQMYSDEIGKTWANIHDYRVTNGKTHNGSPRLGYVYAKHIPEDAVDRYPMPEGADYAVDPETGPWVRKAFEWYAAGESYPEIVRRLEAAGIKSVRGNPIRVTSLRGTLESGFAAGLVVDRRGEDVEYRPGKHEALVSPETWEACLQRAKKKSDPRTKSAPFRLAGLLFCGTCGTRMVAQWRTNKRTQKKYRFFRCGRVQKTSRMVCPAPALVDETRAEKTMLEWLRENAEGESAKNTEMSRAMAVDRAEVDLTKIDKEISRLDRSMLRLYNEYEAGRVAQHVYKLKETEILEQRERLEAAKDSANIAVKVNAIPSLTVFGAVLAGWERLSPAVMNEALQAVVGEVLVYKADQRWARSRLRVVGQWEDMVSPGLRDRMREVQEEAKRQAAEEVNWKPLAAKADLTAV